MQYQQPMLQQQISPIEYQALAPRKGVSKGLVVGIIIACAVVAILLVAFVAMPALNVNRYPIFKGAYAEWDYSAMVLFVQVSGTARIEIVDITSTTYTVLMSATGDVPLQSQTETYPIEDRVSAFWTLGSYQGMEYVHTIYGTKQLKHYVEYNGSLTTDYYVGKDNNWPYRFVMSESGLTIPFDISDTNINWVKNG